MVNLSDQAALDMSHLSGTATALLPVPEWFQEQGSLSLKSLETTANYLLHMSKRYSLLHDQMSKQPHISGCWHFHHTRNTSNN